MPKVKSDTPIIIRLCPEILTNGKRNKFYQEHDGYIYFSKEKAINCSLSPRGAG